MNLCRTCGSDFASVEAFDAHRIGSYAYTFDEGLRLEAPRENGRRCLATEEFRSRGWTVDRAGRWVHPRETRKRTSRGGDALPTATFEPQTSLRMSPVSDELSEAITASSFTPVNATDKTIGSSQG